MNKLEFKLGDKVRFSSFLIKVNGNYINCPKVGEGIIVGVRTVAEGRWERDYEDYGPNTKYWVNTKSIPVVLVASNLKSFYKVVKENLVKIE